MAFTKRSAELHAESKAMQARYDALRAANKFRSASATNDSLRTLNDNINAETQAFLKQHDDVIAAYTYNANALMAELNLADTRRLYDSMGEGAKNSQWQHGDSEQSERQGEDCRLLGFVVWTLPIEQSVAEAYV